MSRQPRREPRGGPKLPFVLQQKLGLQNGTSQNKRRTTQVGDRKQRRHALRVEKRRSGRPQNGRQTDTQDDFDDSGSEDDNEDDVQSERPAPQPTSKPKSRLPVKPLKQPPQEHLSLEESEHESPGSRESSPGLVLDANSRTFKDRMAQDDAEIKALEKRLGQRKRKKDKGPEDELDDILGGINNESDLEDDRREEQEWLKSKRRKTDLAVRNRLEQPGGSDIDSHDDSHDDDDDDDDQGLSDLGDDFADEEDFERIPEPEEESDLDFSDEDQGSIEDLESEDPGPFGGFDDVVERNDDKPDSRKVRENPYVPPVQPQATTSKYVPPSMRKSIEGGSQALERLRKQVQGQLNKLSEANIISILGEIEKLYQNNSRQELTTVIIERLLTVFSTRSALQNTFIILHAAFIAAVYKIMGIEFGAEMVCKLVEEFDKYHQDLKNTGKESLNLISLLANLFTFNVVSSRIIFDHVRILLSEFSESNAELLLRVIRDCGPQLRSDDPTALKDIVQMMQSISADMSKKGQQANIRTRVMMDTIIDLKNNKMKQATNAAGVTGEHLTRMRKALGSLNNRQLRATEPLRIGRDDIANSDKKGKWWLIGSSWKGNLDQTQSKLETNVLPDVLNITSEIAEAEADEIDFATLSRHYKMNTAVRRSIFVAITSATDIPDALARISKLRLTRKQQPEIARVLLRCCRAEPVYNPYYSTLAKQLLRENTKKHRMSFLITLWKFFEALGEQQQDDGASDDEDSGREPVELHELVNAAKMHASLVTVACLNLADLLKPLDIGFTRPQTTLWLELLCVSIFTGLAKKGDDHVYEIFATCRRADARVAKSLKYFLHKHVRRTDLVQDDKERSTVKKGCRIAEDALTAELELDVEQD